MKIIKDERLILRNLQNIKIAYIVQTIGILCILGYNFFQGGLEGVRTNPLWLLLMLTTVVYLYLSMSVTVEQEKKRKNPKKSFLLGFIGLILISVIVGYLISITPSSDWITGLRFGFILFICSLVPLYYVYRLRLRQVREFENE